MYLIQFLLVIFFLFALSKVLIRFRNGETTFGLALVWVLFWIGAVAVALYPNFTAKLARLSGVGRGADLVVYVSLAIIFYIVWRFTLRIDKMNKEITKLVRKIALSEKSPEESDHSKV